MGFPTPDGKTAGQGCFCPPLRWPQAGKQPARFVQLPDALLAEETRNRLQRALAGVDEARLLRAGRLQPGDAGVLEVTVRQVHPVREYDRKRGGTGLLGKVTLADASGEVDLVFWDAETQQLQTGPFAPGANLRIHGATVRAGRRGGVELSLGSALVTPIVASAALLNLEGTLLSVGPTRVTGTPPRERFQADIQVEAVGGRADLVAEGELVKQLRRILPGAPVFLEGLAPHPLLEGRWLAGPQTRLRLP